MSTVRTEGEFFADLLDDLSVAMCVYCADLRALYWNRTFLEFFPEHAGNIHVGEPYADNLRRFYQSRLTDTEHSHIDTLIEEGVQRHLCQTSPFAFSHRGRRLRVTSEERADGSRVRLWRQIDLPNEQTQSIADVDILDNISDGVCVVSSLGRIVVANLRFRELYDIPTSQPIVGMTLDDVIAACWRQKDLEPRFRTVLRNRLRYDDLPFDVELPGDRWRRVAIRHVPSGDAFLVHSDTTAALRLKHSLLREQEALKRSNHRLEILACTDPLTGLLNRRAFIETLEESRETINVLAIDVDRFKEVNDRHGHQAGDECLKHLATCLMRASRGHDAWVARLGGEEFAILVEGPPRDAIRLADSVHDLVSEAVPGLPAMTISIGICSGSGPASSLLRLADRALYQAKASGRNQTRVAAA